MTVSTFLVDRKDFSEVMKAWLNHWIDMDVLMAISTWPMIIHSVLSAFSCRTFRDIHLWISRRQINSVKGHSLNNIVVPFVNQVGAQVFLWPTVNYLQLNVLWKYIYSTAVLKYFFLKFFHFIVLYTSIPHWGKYQHQQWSINKHKYVTFHKYYVKKLTPNSF